MASKAESASDDGVGVAKDIDRDASVHILMIPYPAQPHIVPMLHLAHQLVECGTIIVTFVSFKALINRLVEQESKRESPRDAIRLVGIPDDLPNFNPPDYFPRNPIVFRESLLLGHNMRPLVKKILDDRRNSGLQGPTCLVTDIILWWSSDVASELNIPRYVLSANPACFTLCLMSCIENARNGYTKEQGCGEMTLMHIPGLPPLYLRNIPKNCRHRNGLPNPEALTRDLLPKSLKQSEGILVNTCYELESDVIDTLRMKDVASKLNIPRFVLSANPACLLLCLMSCIENAPNGYKEEQGCGEMTLMHIPGLPPLYLRNFPKSCRHRNGLPNPDALIRDLLSNSLKESEGTLVNTCYELESDVIDTLRMKLPYIPVFPVGPLGQLSTLVAKNVSLEGLQSSDEGVTTWLDKQPPASVVYVCFGTTGMFNLAERHVLEIAKGLEVSNERFLWVLRAPPGVKDVDALLPSGFEERVKGTGILVRGWAPQLQILAHPSTGAFLSSCGWNSSIESLSRGVPVIGWPTFADQPIICGCLVNFVHFQNDSDEHVNSIYAFHGVNSLAKYMVSKLKVAVELPQQSDYFVDAEEIGKAVRLVLQSAEGRCMRERAGQYKTIIGAALAAKGSSLQNVQEFANLIRTSSK